MWWEKKLPLVGEVLFRGELPLRPEDFAFLEGGGISIQPASGNARDKWLLHLSHSEWGKADLAFEADNALPPRELFQHALMPPSDRDAAISCRSHVGLRFDSGRGHVLRDRKLMLRFLRTIMADDGVVAMDHAAQNVWTREALDDELSHDADLDVEGIYSIHAVSRGDGRPYCVHTHGLCAVGFFDLDILNPSSDVMFNIGDLCRAMAFHILEGSLTRSMPRFNLVRPRGDIRLVEMDHFLANADQRLLAELDSSSDDWHRRDRSVVCEPEASTIARLFGAKKLQPARLLSGSLPENPMFGFSTAATNLMAQRALGTYPVLRHLRQEFSEFDFPCLVKLGFRTDGGTETDREHMWFEVHELLADSIDGTLANRPYRVSSLHEGDRGCHSIDLISDWVMMTPAGNITPRSLTVARIVRANADEIRQMMRKSE